MSDAPPPPPIAELLPLELGELDLGSGVLRAPDGVRRLSARELAVLRLLAAAAPKAVSRQALLVEGLGYHSDSLSRAADDAIRCLRAKIERDPAQPTHVLTVHGEGYRLVLQRSNSESSLQRSSSTPPPRAATIPLGDRHLDLEGQRVVFDDGRVEPITAQEAALLGLLLEAGGAAVSREQVYRAVWGRRSAEGARAVVHAVYRLRQKLEADPAHPRLLLTQRDRGLRLVLPVARRAPLPPTPTRLVGRLGALSDIEAALGRARLVSLVGPGGIGKTRLAVEVARRAEQAGRPALFCALDAAGTEEDLLAAVAAALGSPEAARGADAVGRIKGLLAGLGDGLLVLDTLEQIAAAAARVLGAWLEEGPGPRILVTSRVPLGLAAERVVEIGALAAEEAAQLFAARLDGGWTDTPRDTVLALVERLDHHPLAIELAAARARLLGPAQILRRLDSRLSILQDARQPAARHQRLRDTIAWSWALLQPVEQRALAWCSAFVGSFSARAWEGIAPDGPDAALDQLAALREQSMVALAPGMPGEPRFRLLESIRLFAAEQLVAMGEQDAAFAAHVAWFVAEGEALDAAVETRGRAEDVQRQMLELENLLACCDRATAPQPVLSARILRAVSAHLRKVGQSAALMERLDRVRAALPDEARPAITAVEVARLQLLVDHPGVDAAPKAQALLAEVQALSDPALEAEVWLVLASVTERAGQLDATAEAMRALREAGLRAQSARLVAFATASLGVLARRQGRPDEAESAYHAALSRLGADGHVGVRAMVHWYLGVLELHRCRFESGVHHLGQSASLAEAVGARDMRLVARINLGYALWLSGRAVPGEALLRDAIEQITALWRAPAVAIMEDALGRMLLLDGRRAEAVRWLRQALDHLPPSKDRRQCGAFLAFADQLGGHLAEGRSRLAALREEAAALQEAETLTLLDTLEGTFPPGDPPTLALWQARAVAATAARLTGD